MVREPGHEAAVPSLAPDDPAARLQLFKTLGDNTRYAIYLELVRSARPLTTSEIADVLALHPNTVRPHLDRMRDVGLVAVEASGRGDVGRPQHRYSLADGAPSLGLEPPVLPVLARMMLSMVERLGGTGDDAFAVGEDEGRARAGSYRSAPSCLEAVVSDLDRLGFDPVVSDDPDDPDAAVVAFAHCPFGELAQRHPDLVCRLHHGMVAGFVETMGDSDVVEFRSVGDRNPCQVSLAGVA